MLFSKKSMDFRFFLFSIIIILSGCRKDTESTVIVNSHQLSIRPVAMARGKLDVESGMLQLSSSIDGKVSSVFVKAGQRVNKGEKLIQLDQVTNSLVQRVSENEVSVIRTNIEGARRQVPVLKEKAQRLKTAALAGASQMQLSDEAHEDLQKKLTEIKILDAELNVAESKADLQRARNELLSINSPVAGTVIKIKTQPGAFMQSGHAEILILPDTPLIVRAELNESFVDAVKVGMQAKIQNDNDGIGIPLPSAHVVWISPVYMQSQLDENAQHPPSRVIECILSFDSVPQARLGQNVLVSFYDKK